MTRKITIDHVVFYLDPKAFEHLQNYLEYLSLTNSVQSRAIKEERIAEYFLSLLSESNQVNTAHHVKTIVKKLETETRSFSMGSRLLSAKLLVGQYLGQLEWGVN
ncbi:MAG: hypothetical protein ACR2MX_04295 [Cyclobacteriaceae bacterium]